MYSMHLEHSWKAGKKTGRTGRNKRKNQDNPDHSIVKNSKNTQKNHGDLKRLTVAQTSVKNCKLKCMWKTHKEWNTSNNDR